MINNDEAIIFNVSVVNFNSIHIVMGFKQEIDAPGIKKFADSFGDLLKASRHISAKLANANLDADVKCAIHDKVEGVTIEMSGSQVCYPWHAAAVVFSLQVAYWNVLEKRPISRIYVDSLLTPVDVENWKTKIHNAFFNEAY